VAGTLQAGNGQHRRAIAPRRSHRLVLGEINYGIGYVDAPGSQYGHYWVIITAQPGP
jgi:hypothetical protein